MGKVLFEQVCRQLNLLEADYFGLEYQEATSNVKVICSVWNSIALMYELNTNQYHFLFVILVLVRSRETNQSTSWPIARRTYV